MGSSNRLWSGEYIAPNILLIWIFAEIVKGVLGMREIWGLELMRQRRKRFKKVFGSATFKYLYWLINWGGFYLFIYIF